MHINLCSKVSSDFDGYAHLIDIYHSAKKNQDDLITFDFKYTTWFEANLAAVLGAIAKLLINEGKRVSIINVNSLTANVLKRNQFLSLFNYPALPDHHNTVVSYQEFNPDQGDDFLNYIKHEVLAKKDFPDHSIALGKKISESIFELYENARTHGKCAQIHTCGQYYPQKTPRRMDITIVDMGITIKKNVSSYLDQQINGADAIKWALQYGNTTKTGNISGGLGLDIMFKFIQLNKGKVQIISSDGYWESRRGEIINNTFDSEFPGTIANIEFNLDDTNSYVLEEEISLDDIF